MWQKCLVNGSLESEINWLIDWLTATMETPQCVTFALLHYLSLSLSKVLLCRRQWWNLLTYWHKVPHTFVSFSPNFDFLDRFSQKFPTWNFMKNPLIHGDRWMNTANRRFSSLAHTCLKTVSDLWCQLRNKTKPLYYEHENKTDCSFLCNKLEICQGCYNTKKCISAQLLYYSR